MPRERNISKLIEETMGGHSKGVAICKLSREASEKTNRVGTLILDFQFQNCEKINFGF